MTVIVVSLEDDVRIGGCLEALRDHGPREIELILVENGAHGPAPALPLEPAIRLRRSANPGFAAAVEEALGLSHGESVLVLNPDTTLLPGSVAAATEVLNRGADVGAVAFRLLRPDGNTLDSAGITLGFIRRARDRGMGESAVGRFIAPAEVDAACMAGALFRRSALEAARDGAGQVLDTRYFAYKEDVDLGWRLGRAGFRILYEPGAKALHERRWREGARKEIPLHLRCLSLRNRWLTIVKNESLLAFLVRLPFYLLVETWVAMYLLVREPRVLKAYLLVVGALPGTLARRPLHS